MLLFTMFCWRPSSLETLDTRKYLRSHIDNNNKIIIIIIIIVILMKIVIARQKTTPVKCFKYWYLREFSLLK